MFTAGEELVQAERDAQLAAERGDDVALEAAEEDAAAALASFQTAASDYGFEECGRGPGRARPPTAPADPGDVTPVTPAPTAPSPGRPGTDPGTQSLLLHPQARAAALEAAAAAVGEPSGDSGGGNAGGGGIGPG